MNHPHRHSILHKASLWVSSEEDRHVAPVTTSGPGGRPGRCPFRGGNELRRPGGAERVVATTCAQRICSPGRSVGSDPYRTVRADRVRTDVLRMYRFGNVSSGLTAAHIPDR